MARMMIDRIRAWLKKHEAERAIVRLLHSRSGVVWGAGGRKSAARRPQCAFALDLSKDTVRKMAAGKSDIRPRTWAAVLSSLHVRKLDVAFLCNAIELATRDGTIGAGLEIIDAESGTPPSFRIHDSRPK